MPATKGLHPKRMALDREALKKLQVFMVAAILIAGVRAAYIVYERREGMKEHIQPKLETALKEDYYVTPKKLHAYDLKSAQALTEQPVWVKVGYQLTYYPYDREHHKTDFGHESGLLLPLQKLTIQNVVTDVSSLAPGMKQVMACFSLDGKSYAAPIGAIKDGDFKLYTDQILFLEDPHELYKHWPADVWQKIDRHEVQAGMSELQASFAIGLGVPEGSGDYGSRTLHYANGGKPVAITFENDKAVEIKTGT
ncbi:MAG: hypothetical protein WCF61_10120 [Terriglobales bacterium]